MLTTSSPERFSPTRILGWRRVLVAVGTSVLLGLPFAFTWPDGPVQLLSLTVTLGLLAMLAFGLSERWPRCLPDWLARWSLQVVAVALAVPVGMYALYLLTGERDEPSFWQGIEQVNSCVMLSILGLLLAPWIALAALLRQKDRLARHQTLAFELERSELERKALDARMRLLQAQVEPHFLFNTLANVRELVDSGSPHASAVLDSLIAYLRAAVPRLHDAAATVAQELELVRAYLEVMHMRMPDRLEYELHADDAALALHCPSMALLTLVENALRHGIDPSEDGGRIEVRVGVWENRCRLQVVDTGVGLRPMEGGRGTGLATLRERLQLIFGKDATLLLSPRAPHGVSANMDFPAREVPA